MSREFYLTLIVLLAGFGAFMTWLHHREISLIDRDLKHCAAPAARVA